MVTETAPVTTPEVQTETQTAPVTETQAPVTTEGTEGGEQAQTESAPAPSEAELAREREIEAVREATRVEVREQDRLARLDADRTQQQRLNLQAFHQNFGQAAKTVRDTLSQWVVQDRSGSLRPLEPYEINSVIAPFETHNGFVLGTNWRDIDTPAHQAMAELLGKETYDKVLAGKALTKSEIEAFGEAFVPKAAALKAMSVDDALANMPKVKAGYAKLEREKAELSEQLKELQAKYGPPGDPKTTNSRSTSAGVHWTTKAEASALYLDNKISAPEFRRIRSDPTIPEGL